MKKTRAFLSLVLVMCMILTMLPITAQAADKTKWGDANGDGAVNNIDAMLILQYAVGMKDESDLVFDVCDVNSDTAVNNIDAMQILQYAVGLLDKFPAEDAIVTYTVTFKDYDGKVLKTQVVNEGESAEAPDDPMREGYTFIGWDKAFDNVKSDLTVTAAYEEIPSTDPTFYVSSGTAAAGESIQVPILIKNNPGVAGATIEITFDEDLTLTDALNGDALGEMDFSTSGQKTSPFKCSWDSLDGEITENGTLVILTFDVPASAVKGDTFAISISYRNGDIYNNAWEDVDFNLVSGSIVIS